MTKKIGFGAFYFESMSFILLLCLQTSWLPFLAPLILISLIFRFLRKETSKSTLYSFANTILGVCLVYGLHFNLENSKILVFYLIILVKSTDIGGYLFGNISQMLMKNGNHKISKISPNKSWEGIIGSIVFSSLSFLLLSDALRKDLFFFIPKDFSQLSLIALALGIYFTFFALLGDFLGSKIKRICGVKDSGFLPGLGGFFDLFDSLIITLPITYLSLELIPRFLIFFT